MFALLDKRVLADDIFLEDILMKLSALTAAIATVFTATAATAGNVAMVAPVEMEMVAEETGSMGGSGMWLIPLLAIALIVIATQEDDGE